MKTIVQENRGHVIVLTRRWTERRVATSFSEDYRSDRGTQAVETTSAGEGPQFCAFGNTSPCSEGMQNTPLETEQATTIRRIQALQLLQQESSIYKASGLYHVSVVETSVSQEE